MLIDTLKWRYWDNEKKEMGYSSPLGTAYKQDNFSYMANTGLLDANGTEIWEGDIVFFWEGSWEDEKFYYRDVCYGLRGAVEYSPDQDRCPPNGKIYIIDIDHEPKSCPHLADFKKHHRVVVGNIHENPELLNTRICTKCYTLKIGETCSVRYSDQPCSKCEEHQRDLSGLFPIDADLPPWMGKWYIKAVDDKWYKKLHEPRAKPKTIEAFYLPPLKVLRWAEWHEHMEQLKEWMVARGFYHRSDREAVVWWTDGALDAPPSRRVVIKTPDSEMIARPGQWIIKEGDTWRVADKLESDDDE